MIHGIKVNLEGGWKGEELASPELDMGPNLGMVAWLWPVPMLREWLGERSQQQAYGKYILCSLCPVDPPMESIPQTVSRLSSQKIR